MADDTFVIPEAYAGKEWAKDITSQDQLFAKLDTLSQPPQFSIPDAYKDREWARGIDAPDKLWSKLDGAQTLIGKRPAGIPEMNAPKEQWDAFYKTLGRPDAPDAYQFKPLEGTTPDAEFEKTVKNVFHEAGLTPKQAEIVHGKISMALAEIDKQQKAAAAQADVDFDKLANETFGANKDKALDLSRKLLTQYGPQGMMSHLEKLSNEHLLIVAGALHNIASKFISPDQLPDAQAGGSGSSIENNRAEARKLMATDAFKDPMHKDHEETIKKVNDLYNPLRTNLKK